MSAATVPAALAGILAAMPALVIGAHSYKVKPNATPPAGLETAQLPGQYTLTGPATDDDASGGDDQVRETRNYIVRVPVLPVGQGTAVERETRVTPILIAVKDWLRRYPHLGTTYVEQVRVVGDSGVVTLPDFDEAFIGFDIRVSVTELVPRTYADYE